MSLWAFLVACFFVHETIVVESGDTGEIREDGTCTSDDECDGAFACVPYVDASTDAFGCIERCSTDDECKAGYLCSNDGACR
jgi:hypothetical protein